MMLAFLLAAAPADLTLNLTCHGRSLQSVPVERSAAVARDSYGGSASAAGVRSELVDIETSVGFRLENGEAKVRIPAIFLPDWHNSKAGWFRVKKLQVSETEITGKAAINPLNNPSFRIDRMTGELTTSGGNSFVCQRADAGERKF